MARKSIVSLQEPNPVGVVNIQATDLSQLLLGGCDGSCKGVSYLETIQTSDCIAGKSEYGEIVGGQVHWIETPSFSV